MNETIMTVVGNVCDTPKLRRTKNGHSVANFRIASTTRRYDREAGAWSDGGTLFVAITAWRALAENAAVSLIKGQPVLITGRYYQREYEAADGTRTTYELEASAIGHDLTRGTSEFQRTARPVAATVDLDEDGVPVDHSDEFLDLVDDDVPTGVDPATGEVLGVERDLSAVG